MSIWSINVSLIQVHRPHRAGGGVGWWYLGIIQDWIVIKSLMRKRTGTCTWTGRHGHKDEQPLPTHAAIALLYTKRMTLSHILNLHLTCLMKSEYDSKVSCSVFSWRKRTQQGLRSSRAPQSQWNNMGGQCARMRSSWIWPWPLGHPLKKLIFQRKNV